ncbi:MAG: hypothetical protein ACLGHL_03595 [Actinomycetota bacterium]
MRFEFENGKYLGTAEWQGPGNVVVEMEDPKAKTWFEDYFSKEDSFMTGSVECDHEMAYERRDESEAAFTRAAQMLAAYSYKVRHGDAARREAYASGR